MSGITCHVLDTALGRPAAGIAVELSQLDEAGFQPLSAASTDADGRVRQWAPPIPLQPGTFRIRFATGPYLQAQASHKPVAPFYPFVDVVFSLENSSEHYHIPLLLSPFGYSTYRGS